MDGLIAYALAKKYTDKVRQQILNAGFTVQVEQDRSILNTTGQEKVLYLIPKTSSDQTDGYDEYVYANSHWEWVGHTDVDLIDYALKSEIPSVPTNVSSFTNDAGYLTQHQDISGKADAATTLAGYGIANAYTKTEVDTIVGNIETLLQGV